MVTKCIAIGNRVMGDDGIGIKVAEELSSKLRQKQIELIIVETDIDYAFAKIEAGDLLFIIDSAHFGFSPGTITFLPIGEEVIQQQTYSQHQLSLIHLLNTNGKLVKGFIIGIEIEKIDFGLELSSALETKFPAICEEVYRFICQRRLHRA